MARRVGCGACVGGLAALFLPPADHEEIREDFERTVAFLSSVPLFRQQLPRAELPKVAQAIKREVWKRGSTLVTQGETGKAFFVIQSGQAVALTCDDDGKEQVRATMHAGDYFGGHTLITQRPNIATIRAGDNESLVTLSLCRETFYRLGLRRWLSFPKRQALYDASAQATLGKEAVDDQAKPPPSDLPFLKKAFLKNMNLRAHFAATEEQVDEIISAAERRPLEKGVVVAKADTVGDEFIIIFEGSVDVVLDSGCFGHKRRNSDVENVVENSLLAERIIKKQNFMKKLFSAGGGMEPDNGVTVPRIDSAETRRRSAHASGRFGSPAVEGPKSPPKSPPGRRFTLGSRTSENEIRLPSKGSIAEAGTLFSGDSFGELSILFNVKREATYRARENSVVYVIRKAAFISSFSHLATRSDTEEAMKLLKEVRILEPLLNSEMHELARQAVGFLDISPNTRVVHQGTKQKDPHWYVIASGKATVTLSEDAGAPELKLANISRAAHFGEFALLMHDEASRFSVTSGSEGLRCLAIHGEAILPLLQKAIKTGDEEMIGEHCDIREWWARKVRGFKSGNVHDMNSMMSSVNGTDGWKRDMSQDSCQMGSLALADLEKVALLGKGGFGYVTLVEDSLTGTQYALKACSRGHIEKNGCERLVCWERELLSMIDSDFIIRMHRTFRDKQHVYFLLEAATGGSLLDILREEPEILSCDKPRGYNAAFYVACITAGLEHLHERRIVHRDVKPQNTLLNAEGYAKICDMGFSRFVLTKTSTLVGTPEYMAPEVIDFPHTHDSAVDWWSLGVVAYELLMGTTPFYDDGDDDPFGRLLAIRRSQDQTKLKFDPGFPEASKSFILGLLKTKQSQRLGSGPNGAMEIKKHEMFVKLDFDFEALMKQNLPTPVERNCTVYADSSDSESELSSVASNSGCRRHSVVRGAAEVRDKAPKDEGHGIDRRCSIFVEVEDCADDEGWASKF